MKQNISREEFVEIRRRFAICALQGLLSTSDDFTFAELSEGAPEFANVAFDMAEAMMVEEERRRT